MKPYRHYNKCRQDNLEQEKIMFRQEVAAEDIIGEAPHYGRDEEKNKQPLPPLPGTAANGSYENRDISNSSD